MDEVEIVSAVDRDHTKSLSQNIKGLKVLATPAVRRLALENAVSTHLHSVSYVKYFQQFLLFMCDFCSLPDQPG